MLRLNSIVVRNYLGSNGRRSVRDNLRLIHHYLASGFVEVRSHGLSYKQNTPPSKIQHIIDQTGEWYNTPAPPFVDDPGWRWNG